MKNLLVRAVICLALLVAFQSQLFLPAATAGEKDERILLLQEKMAKLQEMLAELEEQKLREQPPQEIPWQPVAGSGEERRAYRQYVYLLAPQMRREVLGGVLEQLYYTAERDPLTQRGSLFVIPALNPSETGQLSVEQYNRSLASQWLSAQGIPSAVFGGVLVSADPVGESSGERQPVLYIDLDGCDQILRARIFELLQTTPLYGDDGSVAEFLWTLVAKAQPQAFRIYQQKQITWLSVAAD